MPPTDVLYKLGALEALATLGLKTAGDEPTQTPFPTKNPGINAEALAARLQQEDDKPSRSIPHNSFYNPLDRPVSWSSPVSLSGVDAGAPVMGIMTPNSPGA